MSNILRMASALKDIGDTFGFADDFEWYISPHRWTSLASDSGSSVATTGVGGLLAITTGGTNNNEATTYTTVSMFKPAVGKSSYYESYFQYSEAATNAANVFFGIASSPGADLLIDDGAGPRTSGTVIGIYKVDGGTVWRCVTRNGSNVTDTVSSSTAGGSAYHRFGIEILDVKSDTATVAFTIDGQLLYDTNNPTLPIKHSLTLSGIAAAALTVYAKAGGANSEVVTVDYLAGYQTR